MGEAKRNRYTKEFKFKVALEAIKGEKQLSELAAAYKVYAVMISNWKRQLLENGSDVFGSRAQKTEEEQQNVSEDLIRTIGHQQVQIDWLKKVGTLRLMERRAMISHDSDLTITEQCGLLDVSRSSHYYQAGDETDFNQIDHAPYRRDQPCRADTGQPDRTRLFDLAGRFTFNPGKAFFNSFKNKE